MDFLDIEINQKNYIKILIALIVIVIMILAIYFSSLLIFKSYKIADSTELDTDDINTHIINTHVDKLECQGKKLEIAGWAYKEGEEIKTINCNYIIKNRDSGKMFLMRTKSENNINLVDSEYEISGIHAQCLMLGLPKGTYDIYVLYRNNDNDILTYTGIFFDI